MEELKDAIKKIESLLEKADAQSEVAAAGYDEGWYNGEAYAYEKVLDILKNVHGER